MKGMPRVVLSLVALLLLASCVYSAFPKQITLASGETGTATLMVAEFDGQKPARGFLSDPSIMTLSQAPNDPTITIHALHPGVAYIQPVDSTLALVTVTVFECPTITIQPSASFVETRVGQPVSLSVTTAGLQEIKTVWLLENPPGSWMTVNADGKSFRFTPAASGTYHFRVEYNDHCGIVSTNITVVASTRTRAVRH